MVQNKEAITILLMKHGWALDSVTSKKTFKHITPFFRKTKEHLNRLKILEQWRCCLSNYLDNWKTRQDTKGITISTYSLCPLLICTLALGTMTRKKLTLHKPSNHVSMKMSWCSGIRMRWRASGQEKSQRAMHAKPRYAWETLHLICMPTKQSCTAHSKWNGKYTDQLWISHFCLRTDQEGQGESNKQRCNNIQ
jgi:hypothetical protein